MRRKIEELAVTTVPIKKSWLLVFFRRVARIYFGVDMTIRDHYVFPAVIIKVKKCGSPAQILCVHCQT